MDEDDVSHVPTFRSSRVSLVLNVLVDQSCPEELLSCVELVQFLQSETSSLL